MPLTHCKVLFHRTPNPSQFPFQSRALLSQQLKTSSLDNTFPALVCLSLEDYSHRDVGQHTLLTQAGLTIRKLDLHISFCHLSL